MNGYRRKKKPAKAGVEILGVAVCTGYKPESRKPGNEPSEAENIAASASQLKAVLEEAEKVGKELTEAKKAYTKAAKEYNSLADSLRKMYEAQKSALKDIAEKESKLREIGTTLKEYGINI